MIVTRRKPNEDEVFVSEDIKFGDCFIVESDNPQTVYMKLTASDASVNLETGEMRTFTKKTHLTPVIGRVTWERKVI